MVLLIVLGFSATMALVSGLLFYKWKNRRIYLQPVQHRDYIHINQTKNPDLKFKVLSYNVLADNVAFKLLMNYVSYPNLNFKHRSQRILDEIEVSNSEIICLQEVDHYEDFYQEKLESLGYETHIQKRFKLFRHGVLVGFKRDKFELLDLDRINLNDADDASDMKKHAAGIIALLRSRKSGDQISVACIHTYFMGYLIKFLQVAYLIHRIQKMKEKWCNVCNIPVIICGDFNCHSYSNPWNYLRNFSQFHNIASQQREIDIDLRNYNGFRFLKTGEKIFDENNFERPLKYLKKYPNMLKLRSVYDDYYPQQEQYYTHFMKYHQGAIDYIFFTSEQLEILELLKSPDIEKLKENDYCPNQYFSSDHLRIEAVFELKNRDVQ